MKVQLVKSKWRLSKIIFVALVWLVVSFFVSCPNIELPGIDSELARQGLGGFTLQLTETTGRTVLPNAPVLSNFEVFELIFTATSGGDSRTVSFANNTGATLPTVILVAGTYNITVNAYLGGDTTAPLNLAARGTLNGAVIEPGGSRTDNINLRALLAEGQGTFAWSVNITADNLTSARMSIDSLTGGLLIPDETLNTSGPTNGTTPLDAGIYNVTFRLTRATTVPGQPSVIEESVWYEMLYVYRSLTSTMPVLAFDNASFHRTNYVVTFIYNDGTHVFTNSPIGTGYQSVLHAGVIGTTGSLDSITSPGYRFDDWWTTSGFTAGTEWNLATGAILRDMTLYARWTPNQITITLIDVDNIPTALGITFTPNVTPVITLSRSGTGFNPTQDIAIGGTFDSLAWSIQGKGIYAPGQSGAQNVSGTTSPITLDANNLVYNSLGNHTVQLNITVGTTQYRTSFWFRIVE